MNFKNWTRISDWDLIFEGMTIKIEYESDFTPGKICTLYRVVKEINCSRLVISHVGSATFSISRHLFNDNTFKIFSDSESLLKSNSSSILEKVFEPKEDNYKSKEISDWPDICDKCGGPAYKGLLSVDCKNRCC